METYPKRAREALERLVSRLKPHAPDAVVVYGSLAKGEWVEGRSDINVAVVLPEASAEALFAIGEPLRAAFREARVNALLLERGEVARVADVFPIKMADIAASHDVLLGEDPFGAVEVERAHLRLRVEQELRNHLLRLRRVAVFSRGGAERLHEALRATARSLPLELGALLDVLDEPRGGDVYAAARGRLDLDGATLDAFAALKRDGGIPPDPEGLYAKALALLARAIELADRAEEA